MAPNPVQILATVLFALAVLHTFLVKRFAHAARRYPDGSIPETVLHFLSETEVVFGVWAAVLFGGIVVLNRGSFHEAVAYVEGLNFDEPKFVLFIMVMAATRPVVTLAEQIIGALGRLLPIRGPGAFYAAALSVGPLLGSFITEPAAMTLLAVLLRRRYFDRGISRRLAYATLGLLFVNVSIGGVLTHFAAPPVLMVAAKWNWGIAHMFGHFGWRAISACLVSTALTVAVFRRELATIPPEEGIPEPIPLWLTATHLGFLGLAVAFAHHPDVCFGVFMIFLGLVQATREYQDELKLKEGLLVGFFLAGLVTLGSLQEYWLRPLIQSLGGNALFYGATGMTALTDNAALTYLGSLVEGLSDPLKYALVAGAVVGGGLTVIANAPNPAGAGILQGSKVFQGEGISPLLLLAGAVGPTFVAVVAFWWIPGPR